MIASPNSPRVILLEFNELTPLLMERFIAEGKLPNFKRFRDRSEVYKTLAAETAPNLEPWIQWVTVHTGLNYEDHRLFHLNEGHKLKAPRIWDTVSANGQQSFVCGSMNANVQSDFKGWLLPDPWCTEVQPSNELKTFFRFIQTNVLEYSNDRIPLSKSEYLATLQFLATHGLSASTVSSILKQLMEDRSGRFKWKRATLLDKLMFDVFQWFWRVKKPTFGSFFANSTAHFQHSYWRNMQPEIFEVQPTNPKPDEYENAIAYGYQQMDDLIGRFLSLADDNATIVFSTAISQQPCLKYESQGGAYFHRSKDFRDFLDYAGIKNYLSVAPVMTHQFHIDFRDASSAETAAGVLRSFRYEDQTLLQVELEGARVFAGCRIYRNVDLQKNITSDLLADVAPMGRFFYRMETNKSGMHHPEGMFWIHRPKGSHQNHEEHIPLSQTHTLLTELLHLS
jgi:hypothetical protein